VRPGGRHQQGPLPGHRHPQRAARAQRERPAQGHRPARPWWESLAAGGRWSTDGDWVRGADLPPGCVPDLVAAVVSRGGRVEAVVPEQESLEDRFLELLGES
jgi:hypothetical protein